MQDSQAFTIRLAPNASRLKDCRRGEIGRHAILRGWWGNPWEFESPRRHQSMQGATGKTPRQAEARRRRQAWGTAWRAQSILILPAERPRVVNA